MVFPIVVIISIILWLMKTNRTNQANARFKQRAIEQGKDFYIDTNGCKYWLPDDLPFEFITGKDGDTYEINPFNMAVRRNISQEKRDYYARYALKYAEEHDLRFYPYESIRENHMDKQFKQDADAICGFRYKDRFSDNIYVKREFRVLVCKDGEYHVGMKTETVTAYFWFNIKTKMFDFIDKECLKNIDVDYINRLRGLDFTIDDYEKSIENKFIKINQEQRVYLEKEEDDYFTHDATTLNWNFNVPDNGVRGTTYDFPIPAKRYEVKHPKLKIN